MSAAPAELTEAELREKVATLEKTVEERERQLRVSAMQNAHIMELLSKTQTFVDPANFFGGDCA